MDWRLGVDYLRCSPEFHHHPRYDHVLVQVSSNEGDNQCKYIFARLCFVFQCSVDGKQYSMALIHPYDAPPGTVNQRRDRELHFFKLCAKPRASSEFISVESIVRGALVAEDYGTKGHHLVVDVVDPDLWLHVKELRESNTT